MDQVFKRIAAGRFSDLEGSTVSASIVVPQSLINEIVRATLHGNKNIDSVDISIHPQNRIDVSVKTTRLPLALHLKLRVDDAVDLGSYGSPKLRIWLENNRWLGSLGSLFDALPEGMKLYGNQIVVDLGSFLPTPEHKRILDFVKSVGIRTQESRAILDVQAAIEA